MIAHLLYRRFKKNPHEGSSYDSEHNQYYKEGVYADHTVYILNYTQIIQFIS